MRIIARTIECVDTNPVSFILVAAGEVDLALRRSSLRNSHAGLHNVRAAACDTGDHCAEHQGRREETLALAGVDRAGYVPLRNVRDLMRQYASQFIFAAGGLNEPCVHADIAAGQGKGIDARVIYNEKLEAVVPVVGLCRDAMTDLIDVFVDQWVFNDLTAHANLRHDRAPETVLFGFRQNRIGRAAHVRQLDVVGTCGTEKAQCRYGDEGH